VSLRQPNVQTNLVVGTKPHYWRVFKERWCRAWESNPHEENPHGILSPERLPFRQPGTLADAETVSFPGTLTHGEKGYAIAA
jgi:hypothetical protein